MKHWLSDYEWMALQLSLKVAGYTVLWLLPIALFLAWLLARKTFVGKTLLDSLVHLPLVLPPIVVGYLLLISMGSQGVIGQWLASWFGFSFSFSWRGAVLACFVIALPLMVRAIRLSIENVDPKLEQAARTLGASPLKVFFTITLPLIFPGIITGTMLSFARSLGEFGATISFVSNIPGETQTLPLAMYNFLETPGAEMEAARLCIISIVIALLSLFISEWVNRRMQRRLGVNG
ncbi:molybdate ABC transporter permease subunit [Vibrio cincinnatiensis]|jgi:molybdate transport system permease protein|uniref:Molybdenum transport system permease n=1 Tax=Vibrio cincinnatiensis DSM 19608 TaxID=1123491 RepID=A0A1T4S183_VIBCI|nr:molybdate ABC transporter permease subunit [Vibrio cincinnatiensis]MCG3723151.1 molybdate ABC transporter permease subunit [Vibrio cincinnatiensis]MCG3726190.1 molybdate ABC transporter permease subunit [Vibrio cincinnatiensis]MCG3733784.1 molybdate ABC transporter permease subunit [Vibrio cincinnatiensis]MCG3736668.1 molybdate ABC transporter permease subunit [Vibrio cincinnatiensis]MCG3740968.1 molybdate ABC transporter permease subunit [Vibrio cincinnatiensis]